MVMFTGYSDVSANFNVENRRGKFIILISILYPVYSILIRSQNIFVFTSLIINHLFKYTFCCSLPENILS